MTRSMTAYGRATSAGLEGISWAVEIHSVNRRGLDLHLHMPKDLLFLDLDLRKMIGEQVTRGQVTLKVSFKKEKTQEASIKRLKKLKTYLEKSAKELGYPKEVVDLPLLLEQIERVPLSEFGLSEKKIETELKKTLQQALNQFIKMKELEGKAIVSDVKERLKSISTLLKEIEKKASDAVENFRQKLVDRLEEFLEGALEDERILKEVAFYAEKIDITEEIIRLRSHLKQANDLLASKEKSVGRTLDFLNQEMLREINTIASKSGDLTVTKNAVSAKSELEKIREQVQNIE